MTAPAQLIEGRRVAAMIEKAVAAEREACAKACEAYADSLLPLVNAWPARDCADAIRARGSAA